VEVSNLIGSRVVGKQADCLDLFEEVVYISI